MATDILRQSGRSAEDAAGSDRALDRLRRIAAKGMRMAKRFEHGLRTEAGVELQIPDDDGRPPHRVPLPRWFLVWALGMSGALLGGGFGISNRLGYYQAKLETVEMRLTAHAASDSRWKETERAYIQALAILEAKSGVTTPPPPKFEEEN